MRLVHHSPDRPRRRSRVRALVTAAVVAVTTAGLLTAVSMEANAAPTLLSQGKPTTASSLENATFPASNATDGNTGTRWSQRVHRPAVDRGGPRRDRRPHAGRAATGRPPTRRRSRSRPRMTTRTGPRSTRTTTGTGGTQTLNVTGTGRYVRMYGTARATPYGYSLWEFQVYGIRSAAGGGCGTTNAALGHTGHGIFAGERDLPGRQRRRRQHRHPLVLRVQRPAVAPGRPRQPRRPSAG